MIIRRAAKYAILSVIVASILGVDSVNAARRAASPKLDKVESLACREVVKSERSRPTPPPIPQKPARPRVASAAKETIGNRNTDNRLTRQIEEALSVYRLDKLFESARAQREEDFTKDAMFEDSRGSSSSPSRKQLLDYVVGKVRVAEITLKDGQTFTGHISEVATGLGGEKFVRIDEKVRFEFPTAGKGEVRYRVPNTSTRTVDAVQVRNIPLDQIEGVRNLSPTAFWHENVSKEFSLQDYVKNGKMYDSAKDVAELERQSRAAGIFGSYSLEHQIAKAENIREQARKDGVPSYAQKQLTDLAQVYVVEFEKTPLPGQSKGETVTGIVLSTFKAPVSGKHTGKNFVRIDTNVRVDLNKMIKELENPDTTTAFYNRIESTFYAHPNRVAKVDAPGVIDVPLADVQVATIRSVSVQEYLDRNFFGPKFDTADFLKFGRIFNSRIEAATVTHEQVQEQLESAYATESEIDVFIHLAPALKYSGKVHGLFDNGPGDIRVEIGEHRGENAPALREIVLVTVTQKGNASRSSELPLERSSAYGENDVPLDVKEISSSKMLPISEIESKRTIIVAPEYAEEAENVPNAAITQDINPVKRPSTERGLPSVATGTQDLRKRHARAHSRADTVTMSDDSIDSLNKIARKNPQEWERRTTVSGAIDGERLDRLWSRFEMTDNLKRASIRTPRGEFRFANFGIHSLAQYIDPATQAPKMAIITDFMIEDNKLTSLSLIELDGSQFTVRSMRARSQSETADESLIDQFVKTYKRVNAETYAELMANPYVVDMIIPAESFHTLANGKTLWSDKEIEYDFEGRTLSGIIRSFSLTPEGTISQIRLEMISSTREGTKSKLPRTLRTLEYDVSKDRNEIEAIESNFRYFEK